MLKSLVLSACCVLSAMATSANAAAVRYTLDPEHTTVAFLIEHVGYARVLGYFSDVSGSFSYDPDTRSVTDISIVVQTASVQSDNEARDKHVRSKDFLNVRNHPQMIFTADDVTLGQDDTAELAGNLQLLGQTQPLSLSVVLNKAEKYPFGHKQFTLGVSARAELQRSHYGMDYGIANGLVGDTVELIIETEALQES